MDWRIFMVVIAGVLFAAMCLLKEPVRTSVWTQMGITPINPPFADTRAITAAWECTQQGVDVLRQNPCDPWGRVMQYPKIWMTPAILGPGQEWTNPLGITLALMVLVTAFLVMGRVRRPWEAAIYLLLLLSPPVLLLLERGNVDGLMFAMVALGTVAWSARGLVVRGTGLGVVLLATMLKLYPLVAGWALLRHGGRLARAALLGAAVVFALYLVATAKEVAMIADATQQGTFPSYGLSVLVVAVWHPGVHGGNLLLALQQSSGDNLIRVLALILFVLVAIDLVLLMRRADLKGSDEARADRWHLDLFLAGSSIYVVSYIAFNNWDYRMVFLLLAVPQLLLWSRAREPALKWTARISVSAITTAFVTGRFSTDVPLLYGLCQASKAIVCVVLLSFLLAELVDRVQRWRQPVPSGSAHSSPSPPEPQPGGPLAPGRASS